MSKPLEKLQEWAQCLNDMRRTVICQPEHEDQLREAVDSWGLGGVMEVVANPYLPEGKAFVVSTADVYTIKGLA